MKSQQSLFSAFNLAGTFQAPAAPKLEPHIDWPYPGMTPVTSAQASMASSEAYAEMLAAVIKQRGGTRLTEREVLAAVPTDWRELCGQFAHATLPNWTAKDHLIEIIYVSHDGVSNTGGGFHFEYMAQGGAA